MKTRFNSLDITCIVAELQRLIGMRVLQIYDIDHKTYLLKLQRNEEKTVLLFESGARIHTTAFEWPKNIVPSGFSMKLRKHLKNKRLECLKQLGADRIIDLQFGTGEVAHHVILEMFDRGNILLTDYTLTIMNVLRPHTEGDKFKFAVREKYPVDRAKERTGLPSEEKLKEILSTMNVGDSVRKVLILHLDYGPALLDHILTEAGFQKNMKFGKDIKIEDVSTLATAFLEAEKVMKTLGSETTKGFIIQKIMKRETQDDLHTNVEFHPFLFKQYMSEPHVEYESFDRAVDEFFSSLESQKSDMKAVQMEQEALSRVNKIRIDQEERVKELTAKQERDRKFAELITHNVDKVDSAILAIRSAIAAQMSWDAVSDLVVEATRRNDPIASLIQKLKLNVNHITLRLRDPYDDSEDPPEMLVDIDLDLSAHANAKHYYDDKKSAAFKQQKTIESQGKVLKSAQKTVMKALKEVQTMATISKARKSYWFEKFFWFISSENYLVIGGRDQQQNEIIVKRYLRPGDVYVHADIQGASSIIIKNPTGKKIPPKTLNEAGTMAVCYSIGWEAKVVCSAWWVNADQVSKSAPTGEYLTAGSFMVRGQKNYLLPAQLAMGFSFLFRLEESSVERHKNDRCIRVPEEDDRSEETQEAKHKIEKVTLEEDKSNNTQVDELEFPDTSVIIAKSPENLTISNEPKFSNETNEEKEEKSLNDETEITKEEKTKIPKVKDNNNTPNKNKDSLKESQCSDDRPIFKRGQKSKLKKIKEKYKDQDEEEKKLRMSILQSAGAKKEPRKSKKVEKLEKTKSKGQAKVLSLVEVRQTTEIEIDDEEDEIERIVTNDVEMINFLTGQPLPEDELLYAIPVVAPYSAVLNYKYKVKLTPGSSKRGKSARTAVELFTRSKDCAQRDKDLICSVNDQLLARNLPGKVKISAPQFNKLKK